MSKVISWDYYCDNRDEHNINTVPGDTVLVYSPQQGQVVELEACEDCLAQDFVVVTELADRFGREIAPSEQDPTLACPYGCNSGRPFKNQGGLTRHLTRKHPEHEQSEE